ncbi:MAG: efflux RND transporter periplasmic adaptor subunit [Phenylobacterium sp.]|uniref:efflux RND transporter periplasmic adaptor subunit n=1 Tax=Phenylobacterium sp. TaxID=1871053 RepID=UPI0017A8005A|nr:efflux RND transporter periplasmic adaptor subunit [Phenylobacterium sp.]MBA4792979.1 efflux RND transporter periplasmic adaptor subunit [Phenylobacterium sp.]
MDQRRRRWLTLGAIALGLAVLLAVLFAPRPVEVDVGQAQAGPIAEAVFDQGQARVREAYVVAAPVTGRIRRVRLEVGDRVVQDVTVVAEIAPVAASLLDPAARLQAEAAVAAARSSAEAARAEATRAQTEADRAGSDLRRVTALSRKGFAADKALEDAQAAADGARAVHDAAQERVRSAQAELRRAEALLVGPEAVGRGLVRVRAPAGGYVTRIVQKSERTVAAGEPLLEIGDPRGLEAAIEFLSHDAARIRPGMRAEVYDWGGAPIPATVRRVEPQGFTKTSALGVEEQRALVLLRFDDGPQAGQGLAPGYRVWGRVILREAPNALKAPVGALVRDEGRWAVFRVRNGRARLTPVRIGAADSREAEILEGLTAGDQVVVYPSDKVKDGVRVRLRDETGGTS